MVSTGPLLWAPSVISTCRWNLNHLVRWVQCFTGNDLLVQPWTNVGSTKGCCLLWLSREMTFFHLEMVLQVRYTRFTKETSHSLISHQPIFYWPEMQTMDLSLMTSFGTFLGISWNTGAMTFMGQHLSHLVWTTGLTPCYLPNSSGG